MIPWNVGCHSQETNFKEHKLNRSLESFDRRGLKRTVVALGTLLAAASLAGCSPEPDDYPPTYRGVPGTGGVGGSGTTSANDTTAGQGNYGTSSSVTRRETPPGAANPESPASTVLPGTTHPRVPGVPVSQ